MAEIALMKTLKLLLAIICYFGAGVVAIDQFIADGVIEALIDENFLAKQIILWLLIVLWVFKIAWFIYDKFYLTRRERLLEMKKTIEEIIDMRHANKKEATEG